MTSPATLSVERESVVFDVTDAVPFAGDISIAGWLFHPVGGDPPRAVLFAIPGGTYRKDYWHLEIDGHPGYSFAEYFAQAGFAVVAVDNLGTGDSTQPADGDAVGLAEMSAANSAAAAAVRVRYPAAPTVGVGHSMGAALALMQQARYRSFAALAALGYGYQPLAGLSDSGTDAELLAESAARFAAMGASCADGYYVMDRPALRPSFYRDDVPLDVVLADEKRATVLPRQALHTVAATPVGRKLAAAIDVPVFHGWGDVDNTPNPHTEAQYFPSCSDYTLDVLNGSGHCHNLAQTRHALWARLCAWLDALLSPTDSTRTKADS
jgi:pimeloyl-ACP methyl ester carboxylesterase